MMLLVIILLIFLGIRFIPKALRDAKNATWMKQYPYLHLVSELEHYNITRVTGQEVFNFFEYQMYSKEEMETREQAGLEMLTRDTKVFYKPTSSTFFIKTIGGEDSNWVENWIEFDINGKILQNVPFQPELLTHKEYILLERAIFDYYNLTETPSELYIKYFVREDFNWNSLNPLYGIGSITGNTTTYSWTGKAFVSMQLQKESLTYKVNSLEYKTKRYRVNLDYYKVPKEYTQGKEVVFFYQGTDFGIGQKESRGWYIITEK